MSGFAEGAPCWADAVLPDLDEGKRFYGELFGWEFAESEEKFGNYTQAFRDGANVAALAPLPGGGMSPTWNLYLTSPDIKATAQRIGAAGGTLLMEPMPIGDYGSMLMGQDPDGAVFGAWQFGTHRGFGAMNTPGAFTWAELWTRSPRAADAFFAEVFGVSTRQIGDGAGFDYATWTPAGAADSVAGRMGVGADLPESAPSGMVVYFDVADCDAAVATVERLGGAVLQAPSDSPFGRMARVADSQGVVFTVIDTRRTVGEPPA